MNVSPCDHGPVLAPCSLKGLNHQIDPYIGCAHLCYYCYALDGAVTDWSREVLFHRDLMGRLDRKLSGMSAQAIYMGWETDPYQPCESELRQTRGVLELLLERGFSASILTKSSLVRRDADILRAMEGASVSISVAFDDDDVRRLFEANTMDTGDRISALADLRAQDIRTSALICPVIPYITDVFPLVEKLAPLADIIWIYGLNIRNRADRNWQNIASILDRYFCDLKEKIEQVVFSKEHAYWAGVRQGLQKMATARDVELNIHL